MNVACMALFRQVGQPARSTVRKVVAFLLVFLVAGAWPPMALAQPACTFTQVTNTVEGIHFDPSISADGTHIAFASTSDLAPNNPGNADGNLEIFLFDISTGAFTQVTNTVGAVNSDPSINGAGTRVTFRSRHNLSPNSPGNADGNQEIFLFNTATGTFTQVTNTIGGGNSDPSISGVRARIAFLSSHNLAPDDPGNLDRNSEIFLASCNTPQVANAGPGQTAECSGPAGTSITLDGSASSDPDGDTLTYTWKEGMTTLATTTDPVKAATVALGPGTHAITLMVDDGNGGMDSSEVVVTVQDLTPPSIETMTASPNLLWPPNHKMVPVTVAVAASDSCDAVPACQIISVSSNEPVDGLGNGGTAPDWEISGGLTVNLRAERSGTGSGRVYTITVACTDASSNSSTETVAVTVPQDQPEK